MSEHDQQVIVAGWLDANSVRYFAVPNAAKRSYKLAAWLKAEGMKPGVPDLVIVTPPPALARCDGGVVIEMKEPGKKPTKAQREWLGWFEWSPNWRAGVFYDAGEAIQWLRGLGYGNAPDNLAKHPVATP